MKFQDLPNDAQHHALSTLRELMVVGGENESGADIAAKVKTAFVSMYSDTNSSLSDSIHNDGAEAGRSYATTTELCEMASAVISEISAHMERYKIVPTQPEIIRVISVAQQLI